MRRFYVLAAVATLALTQAPFAHTSIRILGVWSPAFDVKASQIGSLGGMSCAELAGGLAVLALLAAATGGRHAMVGAGVLLALATGYHLITLTSHTIQATAGGASVDDLVSARLSPAWGAWLSLLAALAVVATALRHERDEAEAVAVAE